MRILIFILALMSAFFVSNVYSIESTKLDMENLKHPKFEYIGNCNYYGIFNKTNIPLGACVKLIDDHYKSRNGDNAGDAFSSLIGQSSTGPIYNIYSSFKTCATCNYVKVELGNWTQIEGEPSCPPESFPMFKYEVFEADGTLKCAREKLPDDCPAGYHSLAASKAISGGDECMPKACPAAGSGENLSSSPMTGGIPFSGGGMYCNDGCAYTVESSQITSKSYAVGTSQGAACGTKPYDNFKMADDGEDLKCNVTTNADGVSLMACPESTATTPEVDPHNNDDAKVGEDKKPDLPKESCDPADASCQMKNVEAEITNSTNDQIENDNVLHNKKIDADVENTKAVINSMDSIGTILFMADKKSDINAAQTVGKLQGVIDAINGLEGNGTGTGGGGNGSGEGNIGGEDCEGTIEECAGIGNGDGVELSHETRNLDQYAQKYNNWLPNAELPPEKCITLTNGKSLCFSFQYFIVFFQAISGLIVLSSLIHSASIIARSV
ncbi:hypothetical protein LPA49_20090 [Pseudoalteromonas sp. MB41]|uniref:hypothetical protein n=1 Tax=Pseudoalteromonas sp. MB41 TaxID=2896366 RepID=UPI001E29A648|nr:hypothetical protein [Pseudoalteromonas sp. MB41]MCC9662847.1 hypothetical protein [Pseudoalteromonas sp. MB41]